MNFRPDCRCVPDSYRRRWTDTHALATTIADRRIKEYLTATADNQFEADGPAFADFAAGAADNALH